MSTPCEVLGYKVGDKFRVIQGDYGWEIGQVIELQEDDRTNQPLFIGENCWYANGLHGESGAYFYLNKVEKIVDGTLEMTVVLPHQVEAGWIEWKGGQCPVPKGTLVDVRYRSGDEKFSLPANDYVPGDDASPSYWKNDGVSRDIVAYRLTQTPDSTTITSKQETTQENKTMTSLKVNDQVTIKKGITKFHHGTNPWMLSAQSEGKVLTISSISGHTIRAGANFIEEELELYSDDSEYEVKPQLKPFALDSNLVTAEQVNEILSLAVALGANSYECVYGGSCEEEDIENKFPLLKDACSYDLEDFDYVGVDRDNDTLICDETDHFNNNIMTYGEAKLMLTGVKKEVGVKYKVEPKLKPFYMKTSSVTAEQVNEILSLAVDLGATVYESAGDDNFTGDQARLKFKNLERANFYSKNSFSCVGVNIHYKTYIGGNAHFDDNLLTYEQAKIMLTGIKDEEAKSTTKGDNKLKNQKPELKSFYFPIEGVDYKVINEIFKQVVAAGVKVRDVAYNGESREAVREEFGGDVPGSFCEVACFNLAGVTYREGEYQTYVYDKKEHFDDSAVSMTLEEAQAYAKALSGQSSKKSKVPTLRQRKVGIVYTNDKGYQLKNVISVDVKSQEGTVNITYKQRKGKVVHNNNVVIPFSELKSVKFVGPKVIGAEYIFKNGKVVQVIQDFTHEDFTHKSH